MAHSWSGAQLSELLEGFYDRNIFVTLGGSTFQKVFKFKLSNSYLRLIITMTFSPVQGLGSFLHRL